MLERGGGGGGGGKEQTPEHRNGEKRRGLVDWSRTGVNKECAGWLPRGKKKKMEGHVVLGE